MVIGTPVVSGKLGTVRRGLRGWHLWDIYEIYSSLDVACSLRHRPEAKQP